MDSRARRIRVKDARDGVFNISVTEQNSTVNILNISFAAPEDLRV
jgi:hypothetical protein